MVTPQPFCAICTDPPPSGTILVRRALGKDGAQVLVCRDCDTLHPRSGRYAIDDGGGRGTSSGPGGWMGNGNRRTPSR